MRTVMSATITFCIDEKSEDFVGYKVSRRSKNIVYYGSIWLIKLVIKFCTFVFKTLKIMNGSNSLFRGCDILIINMHV